MWALPAAIGETVKSTKKFYKFLVTRSKIHEWECLYLTFAIRLKMPHWIGLVEFEKINEQRFPAVKFEMNKEDIEYR